jgi:hypothetical protein
MHAVSAGGLLGLAVPPSRAKSRPEDSTLFGEMTTITSSAEYDGVVDA